MTRDEIIKIATDEGWSRKKIKTAAHKAGLPVEAAAEIEAAVRGVTVAEIEAEKAAHRAAAEAAGANCEADRAAQAEAAKARAAEMAAESAAAELAAQEAAAKLAAERETIRAAIADGATIWCDAARNIKTDYEGRYGRKRQFDNGGCRVGLRVDTPAGTYTDNAVNTRCYSEKSGEYDQFAGECYAVLKAVELATELGLRSCVIANDRIGGFDASTKRGYIGAKYLWVAQALARENNLDVEFARCAGADNLADAVSRRP